MGVILPKAYRAMKTVVDEVRLTRTPYLVHAKVPLLGHHTSGVRKEFYRSDADLAVHYKDDPGPKLRNQLISIGLQEAELQAIEISAAASVASQFAEAVSAPEPDPSTVEDFIFVPTPGYPGNRRAKSIGE
jgi:2-oxoisovalerate dehydrogenase E1 component